MAILTLLNSPEEVTALSSVRNDGRRPEEFDDAVMLLRDQLAKMIEGEKSFLESLEEISRLSHKQFSKSFGKQGVTRESLKSAQQSASALLTELEASVALIREVTIDEVISLAWKMANEEDDRKRDEVFEEPWREFIKDDFEERLSPNTTLTKNDIKGLYFRMKELLGDKFLGVIIATEYDESYPAILLNDRVVELNATRTTNLNSALLREWKPPPSAE